MEYGVAWTSDMKCDSYSLEPAPSSPVPRLPCACTGTDTKKV